MTGWVGGSCEAEVREAFTSGKLVVSFCWHTPNSSHWNHFKLIFLFWFWWTLPMDNLKPYLYYKYRSVFTMLKQTNKTCLTQAKQPCFVYTCDSLCYTWRFADFFSHCLFTETVFLRRFCLSWEWSRPHPYSSPTPRFERVPNFAFVTHATSLS